MTTIPAPVATPVAMSDIRTPTGLTPLGMALLCSALNGVPVPVRVVSDTRQRA